MPESTRSSRAPRSSRASFRRYTAQRNSPEWATLSDQDVAEDRKKRTRRGRSFFPLFASLWRELRGRRGRVIAALGTLSLATGLSLLVPTSTKIVIDYVLTDQPGPAGIPAWVRELGVPRDRASLLALVCGAMLAVTVLGIALSFWGRWHTTRLVKHLQTRLRRRAMSHALRLPLPRLAQLRSGGLASLVREDAGQAGELLFSLIYNPWRAVIQLLGTLVILTIVDLRMFLGALLVIPATWITHRTWINRIRPIYRDMRAGVTGVDGHIAQTFAGIRVVRGFDRKAAESSRFIRGTDLITRQEMLVWALSRGLEMLWALLIPAASAAVLFYGGGRVLEGTLTIGDMMMFTTYLFMLLGPMEALTNAAANVQGNLAGYDRVLDLLEEPLELSDARGGVTPKRSSAQGRIELRNVSFTYPQPPRRDVDEPGEAAKPASPPVAVLHDVDLMVEPGQTIALVGPSGSGKTTLCNLIARFYDPTHGQVLFDGVNLRQLDAAGYRRLLGIVEQDVFLFEGTVLENIAYGRRHATLEEVRTAARAAQADEFIARLEQGYETKIGERGVRLSGGQRQRLAIARAILADPVVLILDEATSNLDSESEALIQQSLFELMRTRTSFVIAHRLSTIRRADLIVVLEEGRIVQRGTHEQLLATPGRYAQLLATQLAGQVIDPKVARAAVSS